MVVGFDTWLRLSRLALVPVSTIPDGVILNAVRNPWKDHFTGKTDGCNGRCEIPSVLEWG